MTAAKIWKTWMSSIGLSSSPSKRVVRSNSRWEHASEQLEGRAMLSAAASPVAAEVAHSKAAFTAPNVAGTWDVELGEIGEGTAVITQNGNKVTAVITVDGFPTITTSSKFTKKNTHTLNDKTKLTLPEVGKVTVRTTIEFSDGDNPTTFTGEALAFGESLAITGDKQGTGTSALPKSTAKAAQIPDISGIWSLDGEGEIGAFQDADLTINQTGKKFTGNATFTGGSISLAGKVRPNGHATGKVSVTFGGQTLNKQRFFADFTDDFLTFSGEVNLKSLDDLINIDGIRQA